MNPILLWNPDGRKKFVTMEVFYYRNNYYIPHENQNSLLICYASHFYFRTHSLLSQQKTFGFLPPI